MNTPQGFLASLFDVSFSSLITTRVIKILYILSMVLIGLNVLAFVGAAFAQSAGAGLFTLILAPFIALLFLVYVRVLLEIVIAIFRIMETNGELVALQRAQPGSPATPVSAPVPPPQPPTAPPTPPSTPPPAAA
jgi:uncharacterized protein DUF4282